MAIVLKARALSLSLCCVQQFEKAILTFSLGEIQGQVVQKPSFNCRWFGSMLEDKDVAHGNYGNHGNHKNDERCVATHPIGVG